MKGKKSLKKLDLFKEKISGLTASQASKIQGGNEEFFHSHFICTQSRADRGCTASSKCAGGDGGTITILCV